tara:strand:+ start:7734 stop:8378 length:645 start_codon:yes stop_codon:yes gene_type:complete
MSQTKRIGGAYTISASGGMTIDNELTITGNLTVTGTTNSVETTNTRIKDRIVTYNDGESGAGVTGGKSGIEIDRGSSANALFIFDETDDKFKISTDGGSSFNRMMVTSSNGLTELVEDTSPQLGGDLDVNGKNITSATSNEDIQIIPSGTGRVTIEAPLKLNDQAVVPPAAATGAKLVYADTAAGGGTGIFFVDGSTNDELVSKSKAIVYGLIF